MDTTRPSCTPCDITRNGGRSGTWCIQRWLGPRSWLFAGRTILPDHHFDATRIALNAAGGALFDVSASYVAWMIAGEGAVRVLNRSCPLDLHPSTFPAGHCAQSTFGHINVLLYKSDARPAFIVMHDTTLDALCRACPATLAQLSAVAGIGERKLETYGRDLLQVISRYRTVVRPR